MLIKVNFPHRPNWESGLLYNRQVDDRTVKSRSNYGNRPDFETYSEEFKRASEVAARFQLEVKNAMLCGIGDSIEEAELSLIAFPDIEIIHALDWDFNNVLDLNIRFLENRQRFPDQLLIEIHHTDLRNPELIQPDSIHFAYIAKVFDLYQAYPEEIELLLTGIARSLMPGGILFSLDYPLDSGKAFYDLAANIGLPKVAHNILRKAKTS
jgi:hypothetical protein